MSGGRPRLGWRGELALVALMGYVAIGISWTAAKNPRPGSHPVPWVVVTVAWTITIAFASIVIAVDRRRGTSRTAAAASASTQAGSPSDPSFRDMFAAYRDRRRRGVRFDLRWGAEIRVYGIVVVGIGYLFVWGGQLLSTNTLWEVAAGVLLLGAGVAAVIGLVRWLLLPVGEEFGGLRRRP